MWQLWLLGIGFIIVWIATGKDVAEHNESISYWNNEIMAGGIEQTLPIKFIPNKNILIPDIDVAVYLNDQQQQIAFVDFSNVSNATPQFVVYHFNEILECSILEDGNTTAASGVGRALVGGMLGGGVGAVVGANTRGTKPTSLSLDIRIISKNLANPTYIIHLLKYETKHSARTYKTAMTFAQEVYGTLSAIIDINKNSQGGWNRQ